MVNLFSFSVNTLTDLKKNNNLWSIRYLYKKNIGNNTVLLSFLKQIIWFLETYLRKVIFHLHDYLRLPNSVYLCSYSLNKHQWQSQVYWPKDAINKLIIIRHKALTIQGNKFIQKSGYYLEIPMFMKPLSLLKYHWPKPDVEV